jgi:hypothetical protein
MIARWPGMIQPGRVSDLLWYFPDVFPTVAELAGAAVPDDVDGMSIVPELIGESAAGRKQSQHEYLYWEIGGQTAIRMKHWKAIQPRGGNWELYDLSADVSETHDLAVSEAAQLAKLRQLASEAHTPVVEGTFSNRAIHERDRQAKFGGRTKRADQANVLPSDGLLSNEELQIVWFSSQSSGAKRAASAIDGDPKTHWHTQFSPQLLQHPHELVIDLGKRRSVRGFRYLARQDGGWNGAVKECEFYVSDRAEFGEPVLKTTFQKSKRPQEALCQPVTGRYVRIRILSEVNGGPWASISELGIVAE